MQSTLFASPRRVVVSVVAGAGILPFVLACTTLNITRPPPPPVILAAPTPVPSPPPTVRQSTGPWERWRLGYSALTYRMPEAPEVLTLSDDDHCEIARVARDGGLVRYEIRSSAHPSTVLTATDQLVATALTTVSQRVGGVRRSQFDLTQCGYPGADLIFDFPGTRSTWRVRVIVGRTRYYVASVAYPSVADARLREDIERFHRSLELDEGDQPETEGGGATRALQYVEPVGASFAIRMPGRPRREAHALALPEGTRPRITYAVGAPGDDERFEVAVTAFQGRPPSNVFTVALAGMTARGLTVRGDQSTTTQGYAGRAYRLEHNGGRSVTEVRMYVSRSRLYEVSVTHLAAADETVTARVRTFFDSLRIL